MKSPLHQYTQKRNFSKSPEPKGRDGKRNRHHFVIQKHDAAQLHYDFRLEMKDSFASWAVPKGLSTAANEKRLAIRTEDHPKDYADFEGNIPKQEYGGGTVMVWDNGTYEPIVDKDTEPKSMEAALDQGSLKFNLRGKKLQGGYAMARTRGKDGDQEQWVIFKLDDDCADARRNPVSTQPKSVKSGRSLKAIKREER